MGVDFINNRLTGRIFKSALYIIVSMLVIVGVIYFARCYMTDNIVSGFSINQERMLFVIFILILFISIVLIFLSIRYVFLSKRLEELSRSFSEFKKSFFEFTENVSDMEDNLAQCSRTTQELILDFMNKFGVDSDEKKS